MVIFQTDTFERDHRLNSTMSTHPKYFCPAPFNQVTVRATGRWSLCCGSVPVHSFPGGDKNIKDSGNVDEWFHSDYMRSVREAVVNNQPLKECTRCYNDEAQGIVSLRQRLLEEFPNPDTEKLTVEYADIKFGNKCNLRCKMCYPESSSELMKEWQTLGWTVDDPIEGTRTDYYKGYISENYNWPSDQKNIDNLFEMVKTVRVLKFTGGEPMINPAMFNFLDRCIQSGHAKDIVLFVTTNCTQIHPRFLEIAQQFKQLNLRLSVDGVGSTYNYVRYPGNWNQTFDNIKTYAEWYRNGQIQGKIYMNFVLSVFNLGDAVRCFRTVRPWVEDITIKDMTRPTFMSWTHAPASVQTAARASAEQLQNNNDALLQQCGRTLLDCLSRRYIEPTEESYQQLRSFVRAQDGLRGIHVHSYIPELESILKN